MPRWDPNRKRLCKRGHDLDVVGQSGSTCRLCKRLRARERGVADLEWAECERARKREAYLNRTPEQAELAHARSTNWRMENPKRSREHQLKYTTTHKLERSMYQTLYLAERQLAKLEAQRAELWAS